MDFKEIAHPKILIIYLPSCLSQYNLTFFCGTQKRCYAALFHTLKVSRDGATAIHNSSEIIKTATNLGRHSLNSPLCHSSEISNEFVFIQIRHGK